jgi:hypothetical protein
MELLTNPVLQGLTQILIECGERVEGNLVCDISPTNYVISKNIAKIRNLQTLVKGKTKICEIGINACHSLLIMLIENPTAEYLLFDLNIHKYTEPCLNYIKSQFPETKINIIYGDSTTTVDKFIATHIDELNQYDLCHIDGGHEPHIFEKDYENIRKLSKPGHPVIFDDFDMPMINSFMIRKLSENEVKLFDEITLMKTNRHVVYSYN